MLKLECVFFFFKLTCSILKGSLAYFHRVMDQYSMSVRQSQFHADTLCWWESTKLMDSLLWLVKKEELGRQHKYLFTHPFIPRSKWTSPPSFPCVIALSRHSELMALPVIYLIVSPFISCCTCWKGITQINFTFKDIWKTCFMERVNPVWRRVWSPGSNLRGSLWVCHLDLQYILNERTFLS